MKKIISLSLMAILAISISVCAFAASSPEGDVLPDKFHINGTIVNEEEKPISGATVDLSGEIICETDKNGVFKAENVKEGKYTLTVKDGSKVIGTLVFEIKKGDKTKCTLLDDGSYLIYVGENVTTINVTFAIDDGKTSISDVKPSGNDSPVSPPLGDVSLHLGIMMVIVSLAGASATLYFRKKYSM